MYILNMREIKAVVGGKIVIKDNVEEIYMRKKWHPMEMVPK